MPYLMGGYPDLETSRRIGEACVDAGADMLELGVPFSDPLADGPVIHAAATAALRAGVDGRVGARRRGGLAPRVPVVLMTYVNILLAPGVERFLDRLAAAGVSGLIVPDLPLEEADAIADAAERAGIALVPLVAPTTPDERLAAIGARAARLHVRRLGDRDDRRARRRRRERRPAARSRARRDQPFPWRSGSGSRRRHRRRPPPTRAPTA